MKINFLTNFVLTIMVASVFLSCNDDPQEQYQDDYFPLTKNRSWSYQRKIVLMETPQYVRDTLTVAVSGDTVFEGKTYQKLVNPNGYTERLIRKAGSQYFIRTHDLYKRNSNNDLVRTYSEDYLFLDSSLPIGQSWSVSNNGITTRTDFLIKSRLATKTINDKTYENVLEIEATFYTNEGDKLKPWLTARYYYSKGIGEVYREEPYPLTPIYGDLNYYLIDLK